MKIKRYNEAQYDSDAIALIDHVTQNKSKKVFCWIGTSMGGLQGMRLAPRVYFTNFIVNDIGPIISAKGLNRLGGYVGNDPDVRLYFHFSSFCF